MTEAIYRQRLFESLGYACRFPRIASQHINTFTKLGRKLLTEPAEKLLVETVVTNIRNRGNPLTVDFLLYSIQSNIQEYANGISGPGADELLRVIDSIQTAMDSATDEPIANRQIRITLARVVSVLNDGLLDASERLAANARDVGRIMASGKGLVSDEPFVNPFFGLDGDAELEVVRFKKRPTGVVAFDSLLGGGVVTGASGIIAGRFHSGKSLTLLEFIKNEAVVNYGRPLLVSLEDRRPITQARYAAFLARRSVSEIEKMDGVQQANAIREAFKHNKTLLKAIGNITLWCPGSVSMNYILERIEEMEKESGAPFTLIGLDYIQNVETSDIPEDNRATRLTISANMFYDYIAQHTEIGHDCVGWLVSQGKPETKDPNSPFLSEEDALAEAKAIARNAHYLLTLKQTKGEMARVREERSNKTRINKVLAKNKFGHQGNLWAVLDAGCGQWQYFQKEKDRENYMTRVGAGESKSAA